MDPNEMNDYIDDLAGIEPDDGGANDTGTADTSNADTGRTADVGATDKTGAPVDQGQQQQQRGPADPKTKDAKAPTSTQQQQQSELKPLGGGVFADAKGNIVSADGSIIAEKGFAARMHQQNQRMRSQNEQLTTELTDLRTRVTELRSLDQSMRTAGINSDELAQAIDFASRYKRGDVLGIAKEIVALAMASGHNATDILGKDVGDSIDMRAVTTLMDQRLGPISKQREDETRKVEAERVARENYNRFVSDNEYADIHGDAIVRLARTENISMQQAYNRLNRFAYDNQLDFTQPLGPQIEERQRAPVQTQQPAPTQQQVRKPMPNGASTRVNGALPAASVEMASADDDWGTIIRQVQQTM